jgi:hypothetical protein
MGIKDGVMLYHIGYGGQGITLGCPVINGVTCCFQPSCWLTNVKLVTKSDYGVSCCTCTPTCVIGMLGTTSCRQVMSFFLINCLNLSSTNGQFLNSCPTC